VDAILTNILLFEPAFLIFGRHAIINCGFYINFGLNPELKNGKV